MSMDAKEVKVHVQQLEKAIKEALPPSHLLDLLGRLKKGVVPTEAMLRETKVGMAVGKLRNNVDPAVSNAAKDIVQKWKTEVARLKACKGGAAQQRKQSTVSPTTANASLPSPVKAKKAEPKSAVDPGKRSKLTDGVDYKVTGDKIRDNCLGMMYDGLCIDGDAPADKILKLAQGLEAQVFSNHKNKIDQGYKRRMQTLFLNLKDKKNPNLRARVLSGEISVERLSTMESHEMASDEQKKEDDKIREENLRKAMAAKAVKSYSDQLTCGKCRQKRVSYTQAQTRSADEPMTTFCTCDNCGHFWKFS
ncbi:transcription elongation factor S-II [Ascodesmis nigricans]|uniref:Transcription elongation factor n=1 Tax=Ascodesmis nigricans TaxID=341454 RepID=A0A4S2MYZ3_9PEZI|nr:transcription elongation factor S-II [Ascodesmis nigricans]